MNSESQHKIILIVDSNKLIIQLNNMSNEYKSCICRLYQGQQIVSRKNMITDSCDFHINKNGLYQVRVTIIDINDKSYNIDSEIINISLNILDKVVLERFININKSFNKVTINFGDFIDHAHLIKSCLFMLDNVVLDEANSDLRENASFRFNKSGEYMIKIIYENFDLSIDEIIFFTSLEHISTHSSKVTHHVGGSVASSFYLIFNILYAFILREFQRKYDKGYFRYYSIILGPSVQIGVLVTIFTLMGRNSNGGLGITLFVLTGILPYTFFTSAGNCLTIVSGNRALLSYRQIKIIDIILSSLLMEILVNFVVFTGGLLLCWYLNLVINLYNPLSLTLAFILLFIITFGLSMILAVIGFYFAEFNYAIQVVFRALFYISGVFFSIDNIPVQYQKYVLWNPLLQIIEFIRFSFVSFNLPHELSYLYLFKCTIVIFLIGISLYFVNRNKFMVNDRAR